MDTVSCGLSNKTRSDPGPECTKGIMRIVPGSTDFCSTTQYIEQRVFTPLPSRSHLFAEWRAHAIHTQRDGKRYGKMYRTWEVVMIHAVRFLDAHTFAIHGIDAGCPLRGTGGGQRDNAGPEVESDPGRRCVSVEGGDRSDGGSSCPSRATRSQNSLSPEEKLRDQRGTAHSTRR